MPPVGLVVVITFAEPNPVYGEGYEPGFRHLVAVIIVMSLYLSFQFGRRIVSHHRILPEGAVSVTAHDCGILSPSLRLRRIIHEQRRRYMLRHVDKPLLFAESFVFPFGEQQRVKLYFFRRIA